MRGFRSGSLTSSLAGLVAALPARALVAPNAICHVDTHQNEKFHFSVPRYTQTQRLLSLVRQKYTEIPL